NVIRYRERGMPPLRAALRGAREVGFTVVAMSVSLVAVFIPMLFMGGLPGRLFREFAVTLSVAIMVSLLISLTVTPMMCARLLRVGRKEKKPAAAAPGAGDGATSRLRRTLRTLGGWFWAGYQRSLKWALAHSRFMLLTLVATIG